jgi:uncharacterized protein
MSYFPVQRFQICISIGRRLIMARDSAFMTAHLRSAQHPDIAVEHRKSLMIPHHGRSLEAIYVAPACPSAAILLFHGIGDRLDYWQATQTMFAQHDIASLVFHYSGYGKSSGSITPDNLHQDALAAYATLHSLLPTPIPLYLLGFSLGSGVAAETAPHISPQPAGLILCQAFTSLRAAAARITSPVLAPILPDIWHTHRTVAALQMPLLVVHGDADLLFPTAMAQQIADAAGVTLVQPQGFAHSDAYLRPTLDYWQPILDFIHRRNAETR